MNFHLHVELPGSFALLWASFVIGSGLWFAGRLCTGIFDGLPLFRRRPPQ